MQRLLVKIAWLKENDKVSHVSGQGFATRRLQTDGVTLEQACLVTPRVFLLEVAFQDVPDQNEVFGGHSALLGAILKSPKLLEHFGAHLEHTGRL